MVTEGYGCFIVLYYDIIVIFTKYQCHWMGFVIYSTMSTIMLDEKESEICSDILVTMSMAGTF